MVGVSAEFQGAAGHWNKLIISNPAKNLAEGLVPEHLAKKESTLAVMRLPI